MNFFTLSPKKGNMPYCVNNFNTIRTHATSLKFRFYTKSANFIFIWNNSLFTQKPTTFIFCFSLSKKKNRQSRETMPRNWKSIVRLTTNCAAIANTQTRYGGKFYKYTHTMVCQCVCVCNDSW